MGKLLGDQRQPTSEPAGEAAPRQRRLVPLLLIEPPDSAHSRRIENAAHDAGLAVRHLDNVAAVPAEAPLVGVGPSTHDPLDVARHLRQIGSRALLMFFTASPSARDNLQAELVRDPFLCPSFELLDVPDNPRQLATRMGRVVANVERQAHAASQTRRGRYRSRPAAVRADKITPSEHHMASLVAQAADAIISTDASGAVLTWNEAAERLFGFPAETLVGRPLGWLDIPDAAQQLGTLGQRALRSGKAEYAYLTCRRARTGPVQVMASLAALRDSHGEVIGLAVIAREDLRDQRLEEALRNANRQKDEFLAIMSHELRTPLTSILGYTDMLLRGLSGPLAPITNRYLGNVRTAGDRLLELVNGLLDYTRLEAGVERLELRPVDLLRIVGQVVQQFQTQARSKDIELHLVVARGVAARVDADEDKLIHVLRSYIGNALKFTPGGGSVAVHVLPDPQAARMVRVAVCDSGIGMQREQLTRVWERFYQGDASLIRPYGGMGLGLSIARHLVTLHGGTVGAESDGPGQGSTFWFSLPLENVPG